MCEICSKKGIGVVLVSLLLTLGADFTNRAVAFFAAFEQVNVGW